MLDERLDRGLPESLVVDSNSVWKGLFETVTAEFGAISPDFAVLTHDDYPCSLAINGHFHLLFHQVYRLAKRQSDNTDPRISKLKASMERLSGGEYGDVDS